MLFRHFLAIAVGVSIVALWAVRRARRRGGDASPGLHQHPERLDQTLDSSDDA